MTSLRKQPRLPHDSLLKNQQWLECFLPYPPSLVKALPQLDRSNMFKVNFRDFAIILSRGRLMGSLDRFKDRVGVEFETGTHCVEYGMLQRFVQAVGDPNPRWQEEAPPTFVLTFGLDAIAQDLQGQPSSGTLLHGSTELECYQTIVPGDIISATARVANIRERQGKMGKTSFITFEMTYKNQRQELVARCRQMVISY